MAATRTPKQHPTHWLGFSPIAAGATKPVGPSKSKQVLTAGLLGGEASLELDQVLRGNPPCKAILHLVVT